MTCEIYSREFHSRLLLFSPDARREIVSRLQKPAEFWHSSRVTLLNQNSIRSVHFLGICGTAMGAQRCLCLACSSARLGHHERDCI